MTDVSIIDMLQGVGRDRFTTHTLETVECACNFVTFVLFEIVTRQFLLKHTTGFNKCVTTLGLSCLRSDVQVS